MRISEDRVMYEIVQPVLDLAHDLVVERIGLLAAQFQE
jgi:hypothetical protein